MCAPGTHKNTQMCVRGPPKRGTAHWGHCRRRQVQTAKTPLSRRMLKLPCRAVDADEQHGMDYSRCWHEGSGGLGTVCVAPRSPCKHPRGLMDYWCNPKWGLPQRQPFISSTLTLLAASPLPRIWGHYCRDSIWRLNNALPHAAGNRWGVC